MPNKGAERGSSFALPPIQRWAGVMVTMGDDHHTAGHDDERTVALLDSLNSFAPSEEADAAQPGLF